MELIIALGAEMGSWEQGGERKYHIMVQGKQLQLTPQQYNLWLLGQQAGFTVDSAAKYLKVNEIVVRNELEFLESINTIRYWNGDSIEQLEELSITPRGYAGTRNAENQQILISYFYAEPVAVDSFGHALWMFGNGLIPLSKTIILVANHLSITLDEAKENYYYWIAFLVRHGLVILNPVTTNN